MFNYNYNYTRKYINTSLMMSLATKLGNIMCKCGHDNQIFYKNLFQF